jgi:hypothetical protein
MRLTKTRATLVALTLTITPALAQERAPPPQAMPAAPQAEPAKPAPPAAPETSPVVTIGKTPLTVSGYFRPRATATFNYEIDSSALSDETRSFIDARSYLTASGARSRAA